MMRHLPCRSQAVLAHQRHGEPIHQNIRTKVMRSEPVACVKAGMLSELAWSEAYLLFPRLRNARVGNCKTALGMVPLILLSFSASPDS